MKGIEEKVMRFAQQRLSRERFGHVERVVSTIDSLAEVHGFDRSACRTVAWLHDSAKEEPREDFLGLVDGGRLEIDPESFDIPKLWHAFHAAYWGKEKFGIDREDLLDAVRYHPTGAPNLGFEGLALFIADYAEPGRPMEWAGEIRRQAEVDIHDAALRVVNEKMKYLKAKGRTPHTKSLAFRDWLETRKQIPPS